MEAEIYFKAGQQNFMTLFERLFAGLQLFFCNFEVSQQRAWKMMSKFMGYSVHIRYILTTFRPVDFPP